MKLSTLHKILGRIMLQHPLRYWFVECLWLVLIVTTAWVAFTWNQDQVFYRENVYFVDGDCYALINRASDLYVSGIPVIKKNFWALTVAIPLPFAFASIRRPLGSTTKHKASSQIIPIHPAKRNSAPPWSPPFTKRPMHSRIFSHRSTRIAFSSFTVPNFPALRNPIENLIILA
jgi:hypothetical protein